ncbi:MAG: hypothetical protein WB579_06075 [Bryobacteraceae bacterium]
MWTEHDRLAVCWAGLDAPAARVRFGCLKDLRRLSEEAPQFLYPAFDRFAKLLDHPNGIFRWNAAHILANLARVDRARKLAPLLGRFLQPIRGPQMIAAANVMQAAAAIAAAQPRLAHKVAAAILTVGRAKYETDECRNVAIGHAIESLARFPESVQRQAAIVSFVRRQLNNPRPATRRKAERFLKRVAAGKKRIGGRSEDVRPPSRAGGNRTIPTLARYY